MRKILLLSLVALASVPLLADAHGQFRHRSHSRVYFGVGIGTGFYSGYGYGSPWYYGAPYYGTPIYRSPPVVIQQPPPVYIEQPQPPVPGYWYYCGASKAYYPYVNDCPEPWQRVSPLPPPAPGATP